MAVEITNVDELQAMDSDPFSDYVLANDINASATSDWNGGQGFKPIEMLEGDFDGQGYTISGLHIDRSGSGGSYFLLAHLGGSFTNVTFADPYIRGSHAATVVYEAWGVIQNVHVTNGTVIATQNNLGAAGIGWLVDRITDCSFSGSVTSQGVSAGLVLDSLGWVSGGKKNMYFNGTISARLRASGLIQDNDGPIYDSHVNADITVTDGTSTWDYTAGIMGQTISDVGRCSFTGTINSNIGIAGIAGRTEVGPVHECRVAGTLNGTTTSIARNIGGIVGATSCESTVRDCYCTANISCSSTNSASKAGGIVGYLYDECGTPSSVSNCYATGEVTSNAGSAGSLVGDYADGTITNSYYLTSTGDDDQGTGYSDAQFRDPSNFSTWNSSTIWLLQSGSYPTLRMNPPESNELDPPTNLQTSNIKGLEFEVSWNSVSDATSYRLQVATVADFSEVVSTTNASSTSRTVTGLESSTTYYWRVRAESSSHDPSEWVVYSGDVTTEDPIDAPEEPNVSEIKGKKFTVSWDPPEDTEHLVGYLLEVSEDEEFEELTHSETYNETIVTLSGLSSGTDYYWRVKAVAESGYEDSDWLGWGSAVTTLFLSAPTVEEPRNITDFTFVVGWLFVPHATRYEVQVSRNSGFALIDKAYYGLTSRSREVVGLKQDTTYYYRVRALADPSEFDPSDWSEPGEVKTLAEIDGLETPTNLTVTDATPRGATLSWDAVPLATHYTLILYTGPDASDLSFARRYTTVSTSYTIADRDPNTKYYWTVAATALSRGLDPSPPSSVSSFTTTSYPPIEIFTPGVSARTYLNWTRPEPPPPPAPTVTIAVDGYKVEKSLYHSGPWEVLIDNTESPTPSFTDPDVEPWGVYYYQVTPIYKEETTTHSGTTVEYYEGEAVQVVSSTSPLVASDNLIITDEKYTKISMQWEEPE